MLQEGVLSCNWSNMRERFMKRVKDALIIANFFAAWYELDRWMRCRLDCCPLQEVHVGATFKGPLPCQDENNAADSFVWMVG
jgi:hypothetical protein